MSLLLNQQSPLTLIFQDEVKKIDGQYSKMFECSNLQTMTLEIKGVDTCDITVEGAVNIYDTEGSVLDEDDIDFTQLGLISASDYSVVDKATTKGIYYLSLGGVRGVRLNCSNLSSDTIITMARVD